MIFIRPLIGVTTYYVKDRELDSNRSRGFPGQDMLMSTMDYSRSIEWAGGVPVAIPVLEDEEYIDEIAKKMDGFVFTGGPDINPMNYGQSFKKGLGLIVPERDEFEFKLFKKALQLNKPILGICRGFQLMNVYFGGTLHQDISSNQLTNLEHVGKMGPKFCKSHKVSILEESNLFKALRQKEIYVNSFHHQAVDKVGEGLQVTATAEDGIIEALEHNDYLFLVGIQWHPEMMTEVHKEQLDLFQLFIDTINKNK